MRLALALAAVVATGGALPKAGVLVPGRSLGGIALGEPASKVTATVGTFYGLCDGCARTTWYFTYGRWQQSGLAVEFAQGRVTGLYTIWNPPGWRTRSGLQLGAVEAQVTQLVKPSLTITCAGYSAFVRDARTTRTVYYVVDGKLWGFGLFARGSDPCR
jgi:hypothetical protein